ncbi:uncharacterized protein LOC127093418 isoform X2 [Lathyrus oleraceus]|uniref:WIYLD domain-containing protein n=1 Tax=Pisum sativum TaxID=3888 RepID=A0A9D5A7H8_PEA|nr:uncharacterized protein LOC127093418 isoform X2 [Pisum sativum]KAI5398409.1 hypothetical protein KIW84_063985 [Pisum sativum]
MAPRRRPVKKGESRMDAALDAMAPFGFPNKLVRRTVDQLLEVYGGKDGWVFIEDSAYTLLINTLLEHQQEQDQDCLIENNPENSTNEASAAGCSNRNLLLPCSNPEASDDAPITNQAVDTISAASETGNYLPIAVDTTTGTSKAVIGLPITVDTSAAPSRPSNQLFIMAVDTATATSKTVNRIPIKPDNTSATKHQPGSQPSIKVVDTVSAINEINNQVSSKSIVDTVSADNKYDKVLSAYWEALSQEA